MRDSEDRLMLSEEEGKAALAVIDLLESRGLPFERAGAIIEALLLSFKDATQDLKGGNDDNQPRH